MSETATAVLEKEQTQETQAQKAEKRLKVCLISSSGGHYEQLQMLKKLGEKYDIFWVTEKTKYSGNANYYLHQTGLKDVFCIFKMIANCFKTLKFWRKEKPDAVITTGTMIAIPVCLWAKFRKKKVIYIETFSRIHNCTRTGKLMYKFADLFIYQWETLEEFYPNGVYGGSIY